jgi:2-polyprenyl-3-methyl-5-hydroxy-6-metoxy-1,4-benzoquinol methylase
MKENMLRSMWDKVTERMNDHAYMGEINRDEYRVKVTAEVFTPTDLVIRILQKSDLNDYAPGKTVLDPACGDGQFLTAIKWVKVFAHGMSEENALKDLYGVDIMRDNVDLCKKRLGGGTILMGNSLEPNKRLDKQTEEEYDMMKFLFLAQTTVFSALEMDS